MTLFAVVTLLPLPLLLAGATLGGLWALAALLYITVIAFLLDQFIDLADDGELPEGAEFPAADRLSVALAVAHFGLLALGVWAVSGGTGIGWGARLACFFAFGLFFGQVSNSNAHELIHRADKRLFRLGMWVYISLLFGHHTSAHRHIHHRYVATPDDPNSAEAGESFYAFLPRAWTGSFIAGYEMERALRQRLGRKGLHPYLLYLGGAALIILAVALVFGLPGLIAYLALAGYAQVQLLLSDYAQHYGLSRARRPGGKPEPVGPGHSWNAPHWFTSALMLNAPRHSAHHAHPGRPYPALDLPAGGAAPMLPYSLPAMATIALCPPLWRRIMDRRLARWQARSAKVPAAE
ncbi:alkane 1-monooxygenase [Acidimangrovimonas pyrenivorans]|uniref:Alkane 1-monooxygenase n=1 Tax=Acidimangrovimonas pyrenivorans TaxID=2030798 RepID=A0ABV7AJ32_9RHOB